MIFNFTPETSLKEAIEASSEAIDQICDEMKGWIKRGSQFHCILNGSIALLGLWQSIQGFTNEKALKEFNAHWENYVAFCEENGVEDAN